jgi:branched-subunit amino acid transport protein
VVVLSSWSFLLAQTPSSDTSSLLVALALLVLAALVVPTILVRAAGGGRSLPFPIPGLGALIAALRLLLWVLVVGVVTLLLLQYLQDARRDEERLPVFIVDSRKTPEIAKHVRRAIAAGQPQILERVSEAQARANYRAACGKWPRGSKLSCDEYPFASARPAGHRPHIMGVPLREQRRQGGALRAFYARHRLPVGGAFVVVVK